MLRRVQHPQGKFKKQDQIPCALNNRKKTKTKQHDLVLDEIVLTLFAVPSTNFLHFLMDAFSGFLE